MGVEYSHQRQSIKGRHLIYKTYGGRRKGRSGERCSKCGGHGRIYVKYECNSCRCEDQTSWSNYSKNCSCNTFGHQSSYQECGDCHGRGYK